jgi:xylulokinase
MGKILAFDLGTTYFKIALFDSTGRLCELKRVAPPLRRGPGDSLELDGENFVAVLAAGVRALAGRLPTGLADVEAVTFATQTNSFLLLDAADKPLTPLILWPDLRAESLEADLLRRATIDELTTTTGVPSLGSQFMVAKLLWLQQHQPEVWQKVARLCLLSDYWTWLLTGQHATEAGAAGLTALLDIHRLSWFEPILERFGLEPSLLPKPVRAGTDLGPITTSAAEQFGLPRGCRFIVGCLDQYAGAIGAGNVAPGMLSSTAGTVLATVTCADHFEASPPPGVFQGPAFREGLFWRMAFGSVSANYLEWYRGWLPDTPSFDELCALAEAVPPGADGLRLRPEAKMTTPEEVLVGLTVRHTPGHVVRAIFAAMADALAGQVDILCRHERPSAIRCAGGAARSRLWRQIQADRLGLLTVAPRCEEPTALGAAILAHATLRNLPVAEVARNWVTLGDPQPPTATSTTFAPIEILTDEL